MLSREWWCECAEYGVCLAPTWRWLCGVELVPCGVGIKSNVVDARGFALGKSHVVQDVSDDSWVGVIGDEC